LENMVEMGLSFWRGKSVFVTGHTGFKGGWLSLWLAQMEAGVHGFSLNPPSEPALFDVADIKEELTNDTRADLADLDALKSAMKAAKPEVVFHLAAQALVRESYSNPLATFVTNIIGTANLLEAAREVDSVRAIVVVTTDKVYQNAEQEIKFSEQDPLGGHDPYSASKAATEIITASYRSSFYNVTDGHPAQIATARAGNVIGGGDWATDRLVPDCLRSFSKGQTVLLRYPNAVRPWQHVLEPLSGYLSLAEQLLSEDGAKYAKAWNFGPDDTDDASVHTVAETAAKFWGDGASVTLENFEGHPHEAGLLKLNSGLARNELVWCPCWNWIHALEQTVEWHRQWLKGSDMKALCRDQINAYTSALWK
jgi:CDP-glucose 4,6-dehydratase